MYQLSTPFGVVAHFEHFSSLRQFLAESIISLLRYTDAEIVKQYIENTYTAYREYSNGTRRVMPIEVRIDSADVDKFRLLVD